MTITRRSADGMREQMLGQLDNVARDAVVRLVTCAAPSNVFAVGGVVRDLILGIEISDIDLAVEGDAIAVAACALPDMRLEVHKRFGTSAARVGGIEIDIAMTRRESYARPGVLPAVAPASIGDDLWRRDFSMNAIALRLSGDAELLDPCSGLADIRTRTIRVLHERSFIDDPERIFRALRYAARLGFSIESSTRALLIAGLPHIAKLSGTRLRHDLDKMLREPTAGAALALADEVGALKAAHPSGLAWPANVTGALEKARERGIRPLPLGFALLCSKANEHDATAIAERLRLRREEAAAVLSMPALRSAGAMLRRPNAKPSGVVQVLDRYPAAAVAALAATADDRVVAQVALRYLDEWRHVKPLLHGDELQVLGVPEGPQIQKGLQLIRAARLDGWASDEGDERALALRFAKSIRDSKSASADIELRSNGH